MSFLANLMLGDNPYTVLSADYEVSQPIGRRNMPTDAPAIGLIHLILESNVRSEIFAWAASPRLMKDGSIIFYRRDTKASMKTLSFKDGFCVSYREQFEANTEMPMRMHITLAVREIECQGVVLTEPWPGFNAQPSGNSSGRNPAASTQGSDSGTIPSFIP